MIKIIWSEIVGKKIAIVYSQKNKYYLLLYFFTKYFDISMSTYNNFSIDLTARFITLLFFHHF